MPIVVCTSRAGMNIATKLSVAKQITDAVYNTSKPGPSIISMIINSIGGSKPQHSAPSNCNRRRPN